LRKRNFTHTIGLVALRKNRDTESGYKVELEGIEPSSRQGSNMLSTCLALAWFSGCSRPKATYCNLSP